VEGRSEEGREVGVLIQTLGRYRDIWGFTQAWADSADNLSATQKYKKVYMAFEKQKAKYTGIRESSRQRSLLRR